MKESSKHRANVPNLRFPGFTDPWKKKKLGNIAVFKKGKGISKNDIVQDGKIECIRYGELYTHYSEVIDEIKSKTNINISDLIKSEENDVIIPSSGETPIDIATASCVTKSGIALGGDLNIIKTQNNGIFLSYYLNHNCKGKIASLAQGSSVSHLYSKQLSLLKVFIPVIEEQSKIAAFSSILDQRIFTQNKIIDRLESLRLGLRQKIFSQELRFKDDGINKFPNWNKKRLKEICIKESSNISANSLQEITGRYKVYGATGYLQNIDFYQEENPYVSIVKDGAGVGRAMLCEGQSSVLGTLDKIKCKNDNSLYFLYFLLKTIQFDKYKTGSTIPHIYFKDYSKEKIKIPCALEQRKIANFLSSIDKKLEKEKLILKQYQEQKKYLLQNLFI